MISSTITLAELRNSSACEGGIKLFSAITDGKETLLIPEWSILHTVWLAVAYPDFAKWLRDKNIVPSANLQDANLQDANLQDADLRDANLQDANLRDANLWGANLRGANLQGANLQYANLQYANLRDANLRGANLRDANLPGGGAA